MDDKALLARVQAVLRPGIGMRLRECDVQDLAAELVALIREVATPTDTPEREQIAQAIEAQARKSWELAREANQHQTPAAGAAQTAFVVAAQIVRGEIK